MAGVNGAAVASIGAGSVFLYAGVKGFSVLTAFQNVVKGAKPSAGQKASAITGPGSGGGSGSGGGTSSADASAAAGLVTGALAPITGSGGSPAANQALGRLMAAAYGWGSGTEWQALNYGWGTLESGWRTNAAYNKNDPYNNAYGIPQANPGTKMASAGANWKTSAATQIKWGLDYIKRTYGSPSQVPGWLGQGGYVGY